MLKGMSGGGVRGVAEYGFVCDPSGGFSFFAEFSELRENVIAAHVLLAGNRNVNRQQWKKTEE